MLLSLMSSSSSSSSSSSLLLSLLLLSLLLSLLLLSTTAAVHTILKSTHLSSCAHHSYVPGIEQLAAYIHSAHPSLKFGIYSAQRQFTCQRRPGSYLHEDIDVQFYCDAGVDYIKLDQCGGEGYPVLNESWVKFRAAIDKQVLSRVC
jgi:hypothetical protein